MAQSVTLTTITNGQRSLRIGGAIVSSDWGAGAAIYTVPAGKRLILKTRSTLVPADQANTFEFTGANLTEVEMSYVLSGGIILKSNGNQGVRNYATGFLEDDI
ncbi:hypothetical protein [Aureimonas ureilytica]|uniref:hypothetical protein n=1 Tax=Aureimonas ureilytica TaxID=401562 RepID=UPI000A432E9D|nr:hypothetical protein [Aureimonas ureilytica]